MKWDIEYTDEFENWWKTLSEDEQDSVAVSVKNRGQTTFYYKFRGRLT